MPEERVFSVDVNAEVDRHFDESSVSQGAGPRLAVIAGGIASGKTTVRKQRYSTGYVLVDAAEIFLSLSRGEYFPFPDAFEEPMNLIGGLVAGRAINEGRHIVTELIGSDYEATNTVLEAMIAAGYEVAIEMVTCDIEEGWRRNQSRGDDDISCHFAEPYQRRWLLEAALAAAAARESTG